MEMTHKNDIYDDIVDVILATTKLNLGEDAARRFIKGQLISLVANKMNELSNNIVDLTNIFIDDQMKQNNSIKSGDHKDEDL